MTKQVSNDDTTWVPCQEETQFEKKYMCCVDT